MQCSRRTRGWWCCFFASVPTLGAGTHSGVVPMTWLRKRLGASSKSSRRGRGWKGTVLLLASRTSLRRSPRIPWRILAGVVPEPRLCVSWIRRLIRGLLCLQLSCGDQSQRFECFVLVSHGYMLSTSIQPCRRPRQDPAREHFLFLGLTPS